MDPLAVRAFEEALDRSRVDGPHPVERRIRVLDALPIQARRCQCALQQRCGHALASSADLSSAQSCSDPQRGEVRRADARPRGPREDWPFPIGTTEESLGGIELGVRPGTAIDELHGRPPPALLVKKEAGPGRDQPVVSGTVTVRGVLAVASDRTGDDCWIESTESVVVNPEPFCRPRREAVNDHIGRPGQRVEVLPSHRTLQIEEDTALAPIPDPVPGLLRKWIAQGRLDSNDVSPVVGKEHRRHRAGHTPGQVENAQFRECSSHTTPPLHILVGNHSTYYVGGVRRGDDRCPGRAVPAGSTAKGRRPQHATWIESTESVVVNPEPFCRPRREAVNDHIGRPGQRVEVLPSHRTLQIEEDTALAPIPDPVPGLLRKWIAQGRLDSNDVSPVVGKEHRRHRAGHTPGQVEDRGNSTNAPAIRLLPFTYWWATIALTMSEESAEAMSTGALEGPCRRDRRRRAVDRNTPTRLTPDR